MKIGVALPHYGTPDKDPDLQYVVDANQSRHNVVVVGIRMIATF